MCYTHPMTELYLPQRQPRQRRGSSPRILASGAKKRVLGYIRVSSDMQKDEGHSLPSQEARIEEWCRTTLGDGNYSLHIERDEGLSGSLPYESPRFGSTKYRQGLGRVVSRLRGGNADFFVVYRLNRIFRDYRQQLNFIGEFFPRGSECKLVALADNVDLDTIIGEFQANLLGAVGDFERKQISQNVKDAMTSRRRDGYPTGRIPYGWCRAPGGPGIRSGIAPCAEELQWVRRCFERSLAGRGVREIAKEMERLGAPPPGKVGGWTEGKVHRLLRQPFHSGLIWDGDTTKQGVHWEHRVVEPEDYDRVQGGLESRKRERTPLPGKELLPLHNLGRCATCGSRLHVVSIDGVICYRCVGSAAQGDVLPSDEMPSHADGDSEAEEALEPLTRLEPTEGAWCTGWQKVADLVDRALLRLLSSAVTCPEFVSLANAEGRAVLVQEGREAQLQRREQLQRSLSDSGRQMEDLLDLHLEERVPREIYNRKYDALQERASVARTELTDVERRLGDQESDEALLVRMRALLTGFSEVWSVLGADERRQLVADLTEYVMIERTAYRQSRLRVKLHFLPEQAVLLPHSRSLEGGFQTGVAGLTPRELALLYWTREGCSIKQIATRWNAEVTGTHRCSRRILERLQVATLPEAVELAWLRLDEEKERLPLDEACHRGLQSWRYSQSDRIAQVLDGHRRGLARDQIAAETGMALQSVRTYEWKALQSYGVKTLEEALSCAFGNCHLEEQLHTVAEREHCTARDEPAILSAEQFPRRA